MKLLRGIDGLDDLIDDNRYEEGRMVGMWILTREDASYIDFCHSFYAEARAAASSQTCFRLV